MNDVEKINQRPLISFCIPTRNRANVIQESIDSIIRQDNGQIEIVVVDGSSSDGTIDILLAYAKRLPYFSYFSRGEGVGVDRDVVKASQLARGKFIWFFSDDDILEETAIDRVSQELYRNSDVTGMSINIQAFDKEMRYRIRTVPSSSGNTVQFDTVFNDVHQCFSKIALHIGFLSGQIVNRESWLNAISVRPPSNMYNNWLLVYLLGRVMLDEKSLAWHYISSPLIRYRSGNDSFSNNGMLDRQHITHSAFADTMTELFSRDSATYSNVMKTLLVDRMPRTLAMIKADGASISSQVKLFSIYYDRYKKYSAFWLRVVPVFLIPGFVLEFIRVIYFKLASKRVH